MFSIKDLDFLRLKGGVAYCQNKSCFSQNILAAWFDFWCCPCVPVGSGGRDGARLSPGMLESWVLWGLDLSACALRSSARLQLAGRSGKARKEWWGHPSPKGGHVYHVLPGRKPQIFPKATDCLIVCVLLFCWVSESWLLSWRSQDGTCCSLDEPLEPEGVHCSQGCSGFGALLSHYRLWLTSGPAQMCCYWICVSLGLLPGVLTDGYLAAQLLSWEAVC